MAPTVDQSCTKAECEQRASKNIYRRLTGTGETFYYCSVKHKRKDQKRCEQRDRDARLKHTDAPQEMKTVAPMSSNSAASGPSSASPKPVDKATSPERITKPMEIHSNQTSADNAGAEKSPGEAEENGDPDDSDWDFYKPGDSDEEDEGQEVLAYDEHCPIV